MPLFAFCSAPSSCFQITLCIVTNCRKNIHQNDIAFFSNLYYNWLCKRIYPSKIFLHNPLFILPSKHPVAPLPGVSLWIYKGLRGFGVHHSRNISVTFNRYVQNMSKILFSVQSWLSKITQNEDSFITASYNAVPFFGTNK